MTLTDMEYNLKFQKWFNIILIIALCLITLVAYKQAGRINDMQRTIDSNKKDIIFLYKRTNELDYRIDD